MNITIEYTHCFDIQLKRYKKKFHSIESDLKLLIDTFATSKNVDLGNGFHKYRLAIKSKQSGKSGGFRVLSFEVIIAKNQKKATLITIFDKSERNSISKSDLEYILKNEGLM